MIQANGQFDALIGSRFAADLLQRNYCIWQKGDTWMPEETDALTAFPQSSLRDEIAGVIEAAVHCGSPQVRQLSDGRLIWVQPAGEKSAAWAAVRFCSADSAEMTDLLNHTAQLAWERERQLRNVEQAVTRQENQLALFAAQVSDDLEELTWLRQLANHLELSETGNSVQEIVERTLPGLCQLIGACNLVFLRDVSTDTRETAGPPMWQTGRSRTPYEVCQQIVYELAGGSCRDKPVVVNNAGSRIQTAEFSGVRSCILVPVASQNLKLGWLIAVNKEILPGSRFRMAAPFGNTTDLSETEFGTFEASLMSATAVIIAAHGRNCGLLEEKELLLRGVIRSLINAIDAKDTYTCGHSDRVAELARMIARTLDLSAAECDQIYMAGLLHDVGKIGVPDQVLQKPGRLSPEEFALIKQHPVIGFEILKHIGNFHYVLPGVLYHHESVDGSGYPYGLAGDEIPLEARILSVADAYDAMTTDRNYRRGMSSEKAEQILQSGAGTQWDPVCVNAFLRSIHGVRLITSL